MFLFRNTSRGTNKQMTKEQNPKRKKKVVGQLVLRPVVKITSELWSQFFRVYNIRVLANIFCLG